MNFDELDAWLAAAPGREVKVSYDPTSGTFLAVLVRQMDGGRLFNVLATPGTSPLTAGHAVAAALKAFAARDPR